MRAHKGVNVDGNIKSSWLIHGHNFWICQNNYHIDFYLATALDRSTIQTEIRRAFQQNLKNLIDIMSGNESGQKNVDEKFDELMTKMQQEKKKWDEEDNDEEDETDALLNKAIEMAVSQGKGWKQGEREAYLEKICDDDYLDPLFATTEEEMEKTGMVEAFSSLLIDDPPARLMTDCKKKGNDAFVNGKKNVAKNVQVSIYL